MKRDKLKHFCQSFLYIDCDRVLSQLRCKELRNVCDVLENDNDRVDCIVLRSVVVIGVGQVLEQSQKVSDTFYFVCYF